MTSWLVPSGRIAWGTDLRDDALAHRLLNTEIPRNPTLAEKLKIERSLYLTLKSHKGQRNDLLVPEVDDGEEPILPGKCSLLDRLIVQKEAGMTWRCPTAKTLIALSDNRIVPHSVLESVPTKVYTIGYDKPAKVVELKDWMMKKFGESEKILPTGVLPIKVYSLRLSRSDFKKVLDPEFAGDEITITEMYEGDNPRYLPLKIFIGNGTTFMLVIQLHITKLDRMAKHGGRFKVKNTTIPDELVDLLETLPAITKHHINMDVQDLKEFIRTSRPDREFKLNASVDLACLATLAGYAHHKISMTLMSYLVYGGVYRDNFDGTEHVWSELWETINGLYKKQAVLNLRVTYSIFSILLHTLLASTFPDVDICTQLTRTTPLEFTDWFTTFIIFTLDKTVFRSECGPRFPESYEDLYARIQKLEDGVPERIILFSKLPGKWPSMTEGGPRYLIEVRNHFLYQYTTLQTAILPEFESLFKYAADDFTRAYARYGYTLEDLYKLDFCRSLKFTDPVFLVQHPDLAVAALRLDVETDISFDAMKNESTRTRRLKRHLIEEWGRYNVERISRLFQQIEARRDLQTIFYGFYEKLRLIFRNLATPNPREIGVLEDKLKKSIRIESIDTHRRLESVEQQIDQLQRDRANLLDTLEQIKEIDEKALKVDRTSYRTTMKAVGSAKNLKSKAKKDATALIAHKKFRKASCQVDETPPLFNLCSWRDEEEDKSLPSTSEARIRARSRSATRVNAHTLQDRSRSLSGHSLNNCKRRSKKKAKIQPKRDSFSKSKISQIGYPERRRNVPIKLSSVPSAPQAMEVDVPDVPVQEPDVPVQEPNVPDQEPDVDADMPDQEPDVPEAVQSEEVLVVVEEDKDEDQRQLNEGMDTDLILNYEYDADLEKEL